MGPHAILYNALSVGKKPQTPKITPYPWDCVTQPEEELNGAISSDP